MTELCRQFGLFFINDLCPIPSFFLGGGVGLLCALVGGVIEYRRARHRAPDAETSGRLPGCLIMMAGGLGFVGMMALIVSFFLGQVGQAAMLGLGIASGFLLGFWILVGIWVLLVRDRFS